MADLIVNNPNWQTFAGNLEQDRGIQPGLLRAVAMNETGGGHPDIVNRASSAGAQGMFQFMPGTAQQYNVNTSDHADSTRGAADYLGDLTKKFGDPLLAGAAYNWGPGNVDKAIAAAKGAGVPTDALSLANHGFLPKETAGYVVKLAAHLGDQQPAGVHPFSPEVVDATRKQVVEMTQQGASPVAIVNALAQSPVAPMIQHLTSGGLSADDIVNQVGGAPLQAIKAAQSKVDQQGFLTNAAQGAGNAVHDLGNGALQIGARLSGNDARLHELQAQQAATEADPTRQAVGNTMGGMIGSGATKAVPYLAAGAVAPEGLLPALLVNGAVGAGEGALTPTTGDGQFGHNIAVGGALGAAGGGAGHLIGSGLASAASKVLGSDASAAGRIAAGQSEGLPVSVSSASGPNSFWRNVAEGMPENGAVKGFQGQADQAIASKVAEGLGVPGYQGAIDTNLLNAARQPIKDALDNATNVSVTLPTTLRADLDTLISGAKNPLTEGLSSNAAVKTAAENLSKAADAGTAVSGRDLQALASEMKNIAYSQSASHGEKVLAGQMVGKIDSVLKSSMSSDQAAAYDAANSQYRNLLAVQKMVKSSNDTGVVTPRQMLNAVKTGSMSNSFLAGDAPFQELAGTASDLYGPAAGKGLGQLLAKATGGDHSLAAAAVLEPHVGAPILVGKKLGGWALGKLASSQNPTLVRLLSGASGVTIGPETRAMIAKALGSVGGASTSQ